MTNEEILQKLEEEVHLRGFSNHTYEEYMCHAKPGFKIVKIIYYKLDKFNVLYVNL